MSRVFNALKESPALLFETEQDFVQRQILEPIVTHSKAITPSKAIKNEPDAERVEDPDDPTAEADDMVPMFSDLSFHVLARAFQLA